MKWIDIQCTLKECIYVIYKKIIFFLTKDLFYYLKNSIKKLFIIFNYCMGSIVM